MLYPVVACCPRLDSLCKATTLMMKPKLNTKTTTGSTLRPGLSSVYNLSIVPELPPAPALLVDAGRAFLTDSLWSAAARRLCLCNWRPTRCWNSIKPAGARFPPAPGGRSSRPRQPLPPRERIWAARFRRLPALVGHEALLGRHRAGQAGKRVRREPGERVEAQPRRGRGSLDV